MKSAFPGFPREALEFLRDLKLNNTREWFQPHKQIYDEKVKAPMSELVLALGEALKESAPGFSTDPEKAIYRIHRDVRFSPDKSPYKTHIAAVFSPRGLDKHAGAGMYFQISSDEILVGGGVYAPGSQELLAIRKHLVRSADDFRRILRDGQFRKVFGEMTGEKLKRVPKGFLADDPAAGLLVYKQFLVMRLLPPDLAVTPQIYPELLKHFKAMTPFLQFLNAPLKPARRALAAR
jgi:uncharacterized protein (TIGR02453 family)